jgi:hypothetical protein
MLKLLLVTQSFCFSFKAFKQSQKLCKSSSKLLKSSSTIHAVSPTNQITFSTNSIRNISKFQSPKNLKQQRKCIWHSKLSRQPNLANIATENPKHTHSIRWSFISKLRLTFPLREFKLQRDLQTWNFELLTKQPALNSSSLKVFKTLKGFRKVSSFHKQKLFLGNLKLQLWIYTKFVQAFGLPPPLHARTWRNPKMPSTMSRLAAEGKFQPKNLISEN